MMHMHHPSHNGMAYPSYMEAAMIHAAHNGYHFPMHGFPHPGHRGPMHHMNPNMSGHSHPRHSGSSHHQAGNNTPSQWSEAPYPSPMKAGTTPSRHLNFSMGDLTPSHASTAGGNTLPHASVRVGSDNGPHYGSRLERELQNGSKEDLLRLILDICDSNTEVSQFVESKAQLFALRPSSTANSPTMGSEYNPSSPYFEGFMSTMTPMKGTTAESNAETDSVKPSATKTPQTPMDELAHDLHDRHAKPEDREFSEELHPCLRMYSNCRYPSSCIYRKCPRNLCLNFIRGECSNGKDCSQVHRIPHDASPEILHLVSVCRGEPVKAPQGPPEAPRELFNTSVSDVDANETTPAKEL